MSIEGIILAFMFISVIMTLMMQWLINRPNLDPMVRIRTQKTLWRTSITIFISLIFLIIAR